MHPVRVVVRHELAQAFASRRFWTLFVSSSLLVAVAVAQGALRFRAQRDEHRRLEALARAEWLAQGPKTPHVGHHFGQWVMRPPPPLSALERGEQDYLGQRLVLDAHNKGAPVASTAEEDPLAAVTGAFDLGFVVAVLLPLLVVFSAHDAVSGEKERGTLRMTLSQPISRATFLTGKLLGQLVLFLLAFGLPLIVLALGALAAAGALGPGELIEVGGILAAALLYTAFFLLVTLWASAATHRPGAALGLGFATWLLVVFLIPRGAVFVAEQVHPVRAPLALLPEQGRIRRQVEEERGPRFQALVKRLREQYPELPESLGRGGAGGHEPAQEGWRVDPAGAFASEGNALLNRARAEAIASVRGPYERQDALARRLSGASPAALFSRAAMSMACTDVENHRHFEAQVGRFFDEQEHFFNALWARNVRSFSDWASVSTFSYAAEPLTARLARFGQGMAGLAAFFLLALAGAALQLRRYDPR
ncbi:MAG TPA: ABC transporter permease subunit [Myxococcaceae bacterium]|jgi:ABC-2 type transport system permease protein